MSGRPFALVPFAEERRAAGIDDRRIRRSCGPEAAGELIADLRDGLDSTGG